MLTPIDQIKPNPSNPREHSPAHITQIARSIEEFGFTTLILVDETGMILAGEGKWLAANQCNMTHLPTRVLSGLTETQERRYGLMRPSLFYCQHGEDFAQAHDRE
jgi:ParB-like chromosome segregation protein Spo0J